MNNTSLSGGTGSLSNEDKRKRRMSLVTPRDGYMDGPTAMSEMMERKRMRGAQFREMKMADYRDRHGLTFDEASEMNFADKEYRLAIKDGKMKGDFAGEGMSFPIASPEDVRRAWSSVGRSDQSTKKVQQKIIRIAIKFRWESGLPKTVRDRMKKGKSGLPEN